VNGADDISEGLSIDETQSIFDDGFGIKKAAAMLREKEEYRKELQASSAGNGA
jgi:hypothetical protein